MTGQQTDVSDPPTVAITGAAGFIGSRVLQQVQEVHPDWDLIALDNQYRGQVESVGDVDIVHVDIRNRRRLERALDGADVVLHLAAISGVDDCDENCDLAYEVNVTGTNNVAWFCRQTGAALAFPFSMAVLGDPETFPITAELPRDPFNWYGRTKLLGERAIETFADGSFPAHLFLKSNLYGDHVVDGTVVSKPTVINFFVDRAVDGEPLTVYEPGTQSRNFVHVKDVATAYVRSAERLLQQLSNGETGTETYEIAGNEDPSVMAVAETVRALARDELGVSVDVKLVENPRSGETMVEDFAVDTSTAEEQLQWTVTQTINDSVRDLLRRHA
ncbi:NAD-dependent epimerase/dehydratase family protein [Haloterrigena sp. SYSU A121-1]|uniref:NAD-dependent epimerase/dehydratase family protein n=1 Tax=Haloterrigena gelatinilytica TaxID=2741724 RepID=A0A8J8KHM4_9EURY|nr:NAD-dependent epimerase/dehydratase family protein [Haloterrigena gelatinilytica]NUB93222.1 NAD-dependent epimerase/dehydratase family protein [Haloterrigena gelatinilytica]